MERCSHWGGLCVIIRLLWRRARASLRGPHETREAGGVRGVRPSLTSKELNGAGGFAHSLSSCCASDATASLIPQLCLLPEAGSRGGRWRSPTPPTQKKKPREIYIYIYTHTPPNLVYLFIFFRRLFLQPAVPSRCFLVPLSIGLPDVVRSAAPRREIAVVVVEGGSSRIRRGGILNNNIFFLKSFHGNPLQNPTMPRRKQEAPKRAAGTWIQSRCVFTPRKLRMLPFVL